LDLTVATGTRNRIQDMKNVKWVYSPLLDAPSKIHLWINLLRLKLDKLSELIKACDLVYIPRLAYPAIPLARRFEKKVVVHLHDYQQVTYCSAIPATVDVNYPTDLLSDMKMSLRNEILESRGAKRAVLSSLATPINMIGRLWVKEADDVICVSKSQASIVKHRVPELADKIKVIYNPLPDLPLAQKRLANTTIMYLGGDKYSKGFEIFLRASSRLLKRHLDMEFLLLGEYRSMNRIFETLRKRSEGAYNLLGNQEHGEVLRLHAISHALLFPSIMNEPMPYAVLEAMLSGTIPITSQVGGIPEIVEGTFAEKMMFEPGNVEECVQRMEMLLTMPNQQIQDIGLRLRENVLSKFDQEDTKEKLLEVFLS
jgi:glycosyltransferase involved in cell wall biosynthesis